MLVESVTILPSLWAFITPGTAVLGMHSRRFVFYALGITISSTCVAARSLHVTFAWVLLDITSPLSLFFFNLLVGPLIKSRTGVNMPMAGSPTMFYSLCELL